jgi:hypothetical protein
VPQLADLVGELVHAPCYGVAVDLVVLVVGEVLVDNGFLGGEFLFDAGAFGFQPGAGFEPVCPRGGDSVPGEVELVGVEVAQRVQDEGVEGVGVDAGRGAVLDAVAAAGEAGVVPVGAASADGVGA